MEERKEEEKERENVSIAVKQDILLGNAQSPKDSGKEREMQEEKDQAKQEQEERAISLEEEKEPDFRDIATGAMSGGINGQTANGTQNAFRE